MAERAPDRLARLLGLVTYLDRRGAVRVEDIAEQFGISPQQVLADVDTLWVSGTPGYLPDDLIDFDATSIEEGVIRLTESRGMTRPLRLGTREAVALIAALRALQESLGPALAAEQREVLASALHKLSTAAGDAAAAVEVRLAADARPEVLTQIRSALSAGRRLRIRYVNAADVTSEREVDPWQVVTGDEHSYLVAWCHGAQDERMFRLDRVLDAVELTTPASSAPRRPARPPAYRPDPDAELVTLTLASPLRWIAEQLPVEEVQELDDGDFQVALRVAQPAWLRHLLLQVAGDVRDVQPPAVAADVAAAARAALAAYGEPADQDADIRAPARGAGQ